VAKRYILQQKVSEGTNRNMSARNTLVQLLLALYTDPESHNAQRYRQTDGHTYTESKKLGHFYFYCNFGKCGPISIILSLLDS